MRGTVALSEDNVFSWKLSGLERYEIGGIHIHEGRSCESAGAHHWKSRVADPWPRIKYQSGENRFTPQRASDIVDLKEFDGMFRYPKNVNRAVVIHDSAGNRVACAVLKKVLVKQPENTKPKNAEVTHTESFCIESSPDSNLSETEMAQFDTAVRTTGKFVRFCDGCDDSHKTIVYRRLTALPQSQSFGDLVFKTWSSENNRLGEDFEMYGSLRDASKQVNKWSFCNYDDENIGFPRDCGKEEAVRFQWNAIAQPQGKFTKGTKVRFCSL